MKFERGTQECEIGFDDSFKKIVRSANKNQDKYALEIMMSRNNLNLRYIDQEEKYETTVGKQKQRGWKSWTADPNLDPFL